MNKMIITLTITIVAVAVFTTSINTMAQLLSYQINTGYFTDPRYNDWLLNYYNH